MIMARKWLSLFAVALVATQAVPAGTTVPTVPVAAPPPTVAAPVAAPPVVPPAPHVERMAERQIAALQAALPGATTAVQRHAINASIARWRTIDVAANGRFLLVNIPAFEISLFEGGQRVGRWRAIVGATRSPTPEFQTTAQAVIVNPWWDIPTSIVRESVGAMMRNNPRGAAARGYVLQGGRYRQRPGPGNSLGLVKLEVPNPHSVGVHDTPNRGLFARPVRALSHGCIRVDDAQAFAAAVLGGGRTRDDIARLVATGETHRLPLQQALPVVVGYFTAEVEDGTVHYYSDIYRRDARRVAARANSDTECRAV